MWGSGAAKLVDHIKPGQRLLARGRPQVAIYAREDGMLATNWSAPPGTVEFLGGRNKEEAEPPKGAALNLAGENGDGTPYEVRWGAGLSARSSPGKDRVEDYMTLIIALVVGIWLLYGLIQVVIGVLQIIWAVILFIAAIVRMSLQG